MIGKSTDYIEVASADFVESRDATGEDTLLVGYVETDPLPHTEMGTETGGETIIAFRITVGFLRPKLVAEHSVEIKAASQRLKSKAFIQRFPLRYEILFQGHGYLGFVR